MLKSILSTLGIYKAYEKWLWNQIKSGQKPDHIAVILDGNRRWAINHSLNPRLGHYHGAYKTERVLRWCLEAGVKTITLYAFSTENFERPREEIEELMNIFEKKLRDILQSGDIHENKVHVRVIGRLGMLSENLRHMIEKVEEATRDYDKHFLNLAIAYGGRAEIIDATRKIAEQIQLGMLLPSQIDEDIFEKHLYTSYLSKQDPDLIIRTSGEERLSGFLLYQSAYSELCFLDVYWPEFRRIDLLRAIRTYQTRKRRFGK